MQQLGALEVKYHAKEYHQIKYLSETAYLAFCLQLCYTGHTMDKVTKPGRSAPSKGRTTTT